jgi:hypothetical protein
MELRIAGRIFSFRRTVARGGLCGRGLADYRRDTLPARRRKGAIVEWPAADEPLEPSEDCALAHAAISGSA